MHTLFGGGPEGPTGFSDYPRFIANLQDSINDQASAVRFYKRLMDLARTPKQREYIKHAHDDEIKHYNMFTALYRNLTGKEPAVQVKETSFPNYKAGLGKAFDAELEAAELYRNMYLSTNLAEIRDIFFETMTDEMEHAQKFSFIYHQL